LLFLQCGVLGPDTVPNQFCPSAFSTDETFKGQLTLASGRLEPERIFGFKDLPPVAAT
jgi:hypothetical protein